MNNFPRKALASSTNHWDHCFKLVIVSPAVCVVVDTLCAVLFKDVHSLVLGSTCKYSTTPYASRYNYIVDAISHTVCCLAVYHGYSNVYYF